MSYGNCSTKKKGRRWCSRERNAGPSGWPQQLIRDGFTATMIHGDRSQSQRNGALSGFQEGAFQVLVATDIASRGLHVDDVAHVVNYDLPKMAEDFIHRVGRTGRAGLQGRATTLVTGAEVLELRTIERKLQLKIERMQLNASISDRPKPVVQNTLASRTLTALPAKFSFKLLLTAVSFPRRAAGRLLDPAHKRIHIKGLACGWRCGGNSLET